MFDVGSIINNQIKNDHVTILYMDMNLQNRKLEIEWWSRGDSNPLPFDCQSNVLPSELRPQRTKDNLT